MKLLWKGLSSHTELLGVYREERLRAEVPKDPRWERRSVTV